MKVAVSFLKTKTTLEDTIKELDSSSADYIHVDVIDGEFTGIKNFSPEDLITLLSNVEKPLDVHLMVNDPNYYIDALANLNVRYFTIHAEVDINVLDTIKKIKSYGIGAGIAINPDTDIKVLNAYANMLDQVLVMGVVPGAGGQALIPSTVDKVRALYKIREDYQNHYIIAFDGGVNNETRKLLDDVDLIVAGSYVVLNDNLEDAIASLR